MNICVYAASSGLANNAFTAAAERLGAAIAHRGHTLINGAGRTGLMAASTNGALAAGGEAVGVIPQFMIDHGWQHEGMTRLIVTPDMHTRKEQMAAMADACIALPGGVGTLEELLEIITWKQLGLFVKPIVVLNIDSYFDPLLAQLKRAVDEQLMRPLHTGLWCATASPEEAVKLCETTPLWDDTLAKYAAIQA